MNTKSVIVSISPGAPEFERERIAQAARRTYDAIGESDARFDIEGVVLLGTVFQQLGVDIEGRQTIMQPFRLAKLTDEKSGKAVYVNLDCVLLVYEAPHGAQIVMRTGAGTATTPMLSVRETAADVVLHLEGTK